MSKPMGSTANNLAPVNPSTQQPASIQEYSIRVPKNLKKRYHVMQFSDNVDFTTWKNVKMERENNMKEYKGIEEEQPKFGAGSEYNRDLKEEMKRKRAGIAARKYQPDAQPWILKLGGKTGKKFRGQREGGVSQNAAFYVFTHAPDGAIEAYPLNEWYNFKPIHRYKALSAEEAEAEFSHRKKVLNYFSLMLRKRLKGDEEETPDKEETLAKKGAKNSKKDLKISDMDEDAWMDSDDLSSSDEEKEKEKKEDSDDDNKKKKQNKKKITDKKKKKKDSDDEAFEESDDGDEEGRELDYISDSSDSESEPESKPNKELKGVAEEDALRKLLTSEEESEEEEKKSDEENENDEEKKKEGKEKDSKDGKDAKDGKDKKKKKIKKKNKETKTNSSSDFSSDSSDSEAETNNKKKKKDASANNSRAGTPILDGASSSKRKLPVSNSMPSDLALTSDNSNSPTATPAKKPKIDTAAPSVPPTFAGVINNNKEDYSSIEDAVRRYLMRKPMTTKELLTKFKNKKTVVPSEKLLETMTQILKKINPVKQTIQGKLYLSIKAPK